MTENDKRQKLKTYLRKNKVSSNVLCERIRQATPSRIAPQTINRWLRKEQTITLQTWDVINKHIEQ